MRNVSLQNNDDTQFQCCDRRSGGWKAIALREYQAVPGTVDTNLYGLDIAQAIRNAYRNRIGGKKRSDDSDTHTRSHNASRHVQIRWKSDHLIIKITN